MKVINLVAALLSLLLLSCQQQPADDEPSAEDAGTSEENTSPDMGEHPQWTLHSSIYELNIRQHTAEGTLNAMRKKLPDLQKLGVKMLWLMPVQPIGREERQGELGNCYAIRDYMDINPELGNMQDFKDFVTAAHDLGFKVILDWMAPYTARDAKWVRKNPEWYQKKDGQMVSPGSEEKDVYQLDFGNKVVKSEMLRAMKFWVDSTGIDGFRCAQAGAVPMDFWQLARKSLDSIKPIFMLADAEGPQFHPAFDMTCGFELNELMTALAQNERSTAALDSYYVRMDTSYPENAFRMYFTSGYEINSNEGHTKMRLGADSRNLFILSATMPQAVPMLYSGQEFGLQQQLKRFDKDTITATDTSLFKWYQQVIGLKMQHPALAMEPHGGSFNRYADYGEPELYAFSRSKNNKKILVVLNFSDEEKSFDLRKNSLGSDWQPVIDQDEFDVNEQGRVRVAPHSYLLAKK